MAQFGASLCVSLVLLTMFEAEIGSCASPYQPSCATLKCPPRQVCILREPECLGFSCPTPRPVCSPAHEAEATETSASTEETIESTEETTASEATEETTTEITDEAKTESTEETTASEVTEETTTSAITEETSTESTEETPTTEAT